MAEEYYPEKVGNTQQPFSGAWLAYFPYQRGPWNMCDGFPFPENPIKNDRIPNDCQLFCYVCYKIGNLPLRFITFYSFLIIYIQKALIIKPMISYRNSGPILFPLALHDMKSH